MRGGTAPYTGRQRFLWAHIIQCLEYSLHFTECHFLLRQEFDCGKQGKSIHLSQTYWNPFYSPNFWFYKTSASVHSNLPRHRFKCCSYLKSVLTVGFDVALKTVRICPPSDSMSLKTCFPGWSVSSRSLGPLLVSLWHYLLDCSQTSTLHESQINQERPFFSPTDNITLPLC